MTAMAVLTEESVEKLAAVLDRVCEKDPAALADGDTIEALHRQLARLEAATARAAAAFDVARGWEADGARSAAAWISTRCRRPLGEARRRVAAGRRLRDMPQVDAAWTAGDISASHVDVLGRAWTPASAQLFARDEQLLCEEARQLRFHHFVQVVAYWRYRADPDGVEADAAAQRDGRRVYLSKGRAGMRFLDGVLDPIGGAIVEKVLADIEDELFRHDWAEATARRGEHARASDPGDPRDLGRTPAQRRADALVEMARRAASAPPGARMLGQWRPHRPGQRQTGLSVSQPGTAPTNVAPVRDAGGGRVEPFMPHLVPGHRWVGDRRRGRRPAPAGGARPAEGPRDCSGPHVPHRRLLKPVRPVGPNRPHRRLPRNEAGSGSGVADGAAGRPSHGAAPAQCRTKPARAAREAALWRSSAPAAHSRPGCSAHRRARTSRGAC